MEIEEAIRSRRSIRAYREGDIEDSVIEEILDLARHAPSSMNGQPWRFVVVREKETKRRLVEIKNRHCPIEKQAYRADFLGHASAIIVVCVDRKDSFDREIENGLLAAANILLAAHAKGLGSVYMSAHKAGEPAVAQEIRQALGVPGHIDPISLVPLGWPDERPEPKEMKPPREIISYEVFGKR
jgi:nitroreductase